MSNFREPTGEELREAFISLAKKVQRYCGSVSPEKCRAEKCPFTHKEYGCITEALGMNSPYDWDMEGDNDG